MSDEAPVSAVVQALRMQAGFCRRMSSPLNAELLDRAALDWLADGPVRPLLAPWESQSLQAQFDAAIPLRLIGSWHELALSGDDAATAAAYAALDADAIWAALTVAMAERADRLAAFMSHEPQTNEVRRSICLLGGFLEIAAATGLPMRAFEIAASAGLNLSWDRYHYRMGDVAWGDPAASVRMDTLWTGATPPVGAPVQVIERAACDRRPTDLHDPVQRRRLMAYVWADQSERLARLRSAIEVALANGVEVQAADAAAWVRAKVRPQAGAVTVLYHSVFWQYMTLRDRAALRALIGEIGVEATAETPFAWLRMEPPEDMMGMEVKLTLWPGGEERKLADVHPHGAEVRWSGANLS